MVCPVCGASLTDGDKFCGTCGFQISKCPAARGQASAKQLAYRSACHRYQRVFVAEDYIPLTHPRRRIA